MAGRGGGRGGKRASRIGLSERVQIEQWLAEGFSQAEVARKSGRHYNTIASIAAGERKRYQATGSAAEALEDFGLFRRRYLGRIATPWQVMAAELIVELLDSEDDEYLVLNCPPGSGKSTLMTDICTWVLARDRAKRILYGSAAQAPASDYTNRVMNDLVRPDPTRASARDVKFNLAVDSVATLEADYGRFKPANGARWTKEKFYVQQIDGATVQEKEPNMVAFGRDSTFLGGRFDLCIWDDLVSEKTLRTQEARDALVQWWNNTAETRTEPGGLHVLVGQRLNADDLYRYCIDLPSGLDEDDPGDVEITLREGYARKYRHIVFPAHDESKCKGKVDNPDHRLDAPYWPEGCLLDPRRLSWKKLTMLQANPLNQFQTVYQQQDTDPSTALVQKIWVDGGTGPDGISYVGCRDENRGLGEIPHGLGTAWSVVSVDPSPSRYWSIQWYLCDQPTKTMHLIDHARSTMTAPDWLDYNISEQKFVGFAEDWWQRSKEMNRPITHMIVEQNAAQKFMLQSDAIRKWQASRGVLIIPHSTHSNKADKEYGVQSIAPLWMHGRIRLPMGDEAGRLASFHLIREATTWPHGSTDDCVMAQWFVHYQWPRINPVRSNVYRIRPEDYIARRARRGLGDMTA